MRIVAHVGVKDEAGLIARAIDHLYSIGVDEIICTDMGSTDGSLDILEGFRRRSPLRVVELDDRAPGALQDWSAGVTEIVKSAGADWVIFLDADEFPIPESGNLKDTRALSDADVLLIDRFNVPLLADGVHFPYSASRDEQGAIALIVEPIANFQSHLMDHPDTPWIMGIPMPKAMIRPALASSVGIGGHDIVPVENVHLRRMRPADLLIAHLPFTERRRFISKLKNVTLAIEANPEFFKDGIAWHWRRWLEQLRDGTLDSEFERQVTTPAQFQDLRARGIVSTASEWFAKQGGLSRPA